MMIARPAPTFLGYFLKNVTARPGWLADPRVQDICSVSDCISKSPERVWTRWAFNHSGFYDTPELAAQDAEAGVQYDVFGYEMFPLVFEDGHMRSVAVSAWLNTNDSHLPAHHLPGSQLLGFDVISTRPATLGTSHTAPTMVSFECSPLSCNGRCTEYQINRHCLLDEWEEAVRAAMDFSVDQPEPGRYVIFAVHRRPHDGDRVRGDRRRGRPA